MRCLGSYSIGNYTFLGKDLGCKNASEKEARVQEKSLGRLEILGDLDEGGTKEA